MKNVLPSNLSVNKIMDNWVNKAGYPVITATKNNKSEIELKQERFFLTKPLKQDNTQWYIPIDYLKQDSEQFSKIEWMEPEQPKTLTKMDAKENNKWILINKDQAGYYRVNYDKNNWKLLTEYLKSTEIQNSSIKATNRAQLIDDALNLARAGDLDYTTSMGITLYLTKEDDYIPWIAAVRAFDYLDTLLQGTEKYALFKNYVAQRVKSFADKFDIENFASNNTHVDKLAKVLALNAACKYGVEKCEKFAEKEIKEWLEEKKDGKEEKKLLIDYRSTLLCAGLRKADEQTWNKTLEKYETTADKDEQNEILAGLGCVTNEKIVNTFLESTLEKDSGISVFDAMNSVARGNPASFNLLIGFINTNLKTIRGEENKNRELLLNHLDLLARKVITHEQYTELSLLVHVHLEEHEVFEGFSHAMDNIAWIKHHQQTVSKWIEENQDDSNQDNKKDPNSASSFVLSSFLIMIPLLLTRL
ncbi:hypothetical protein DMN91_001042 [Ooceraea biroi]|uniref:Aminopeptidase N n=2 Tax=Ooceraea biroi TaxID=2015173 RepID=A0A3L8E3H0_OOCBI|nr:hypothetical protein DMN91_001042 [Ooceraea biroi]